MDNKFKNLLAKRKSKKTASQESTTHFWYKASVKNTNDEEVHTLKLDSMNKIFDLKNILVEKTQTKIVIDGSAFGSRGLVTSLKKEHPERIIESTSTLEYTPYFCETECVSKLEGCILITGGTGALGRECSKYFLDKYPNVHQVLVSRKSDPSKSTANITHVACDVTSQDDLERIVSLRNDWIGVIHNAGIFPSGKMFVKSLKEEWSCMINIKKNAVENIWKCFHRKMEFFVLASSIIAGLGESGNVPYLTANSCMDEFALTHTSNSIPVCSIQWGALDIEGSMATSNHLKVTQSRGWGIVTPHIIHKTLDLIVCKKCPPVLLVSPVSPTVFTEKEKNKSKNRFSI